MKYKVQIQCIGEYPFSLPFQQHASGLWCRSSVVHSPSLPSLSATWGCRPAPLLLPACSETYHWRPVEQHGHVQSYSVKHEPNITNQTVSEAVIIYLTLRRYDAHFCVVLLIIALALDLQLFKFPPWHQSLILLSCIFKMKLRYQATLKAITVLPFLWWGVHWCNKVRS